MPKIVKRVGAAVAIATAAIAVPATIASCGVRADVDTVELIVADLVKAGPAIKELLEVVRAIRDDLTAHNTAHHPAAVGGDAGGSSGG